MHARRSRSIPPPAAGASFKRPSLDNQVNIRSSGVLGQRVHVNVDFDTERDYTSNNDIQVYYEGLEDEIVRRVDVGTVIFQPPPSRFITAAVPANNFGVNATFEFGPLQLQTLAATQKGSVVAERTYTIGQTTSQAQDRQVARPRLRVRPLLLGGGPGQPARLPRGRHPEARSRDDRRPTYRPTEVRVYRYRAASGNSGVNPEPGRHHRARPARTDSAGAVRRRCAGSC